MAVVLLFLRFSGYRAYSVSTCRQSGRSECFLWFCRAKMISMVLCAAINRLLPAYRARRRRNRRVSFDCLCCTCRPPTIYHPRCANVPWLVIIAVCRQLFTSGFCHWPSHCPAQRDFIRFHLWRYRTSWTIKLLHCPRGSKRTALFLAELVLSACKITHEPLQVARWNFAQTCIVITARNLLNFKVIGQRSRSHARTLCVFLCAWRCGYPRTVLSPEQGLMILLSFLHIPPTHDVSHTMCKVQANVPWLVSMERLQRLGSFTSIRSFASTVGIRSNTQAVRSKAVFQSNF